MILVLKNTKKIFYEKADYAILKILELHPSRELLFPLILEGFNDKHKSIKKFCGMYVYKMLDKWRDKIPLIQMKDCLIQNALDRDEKVRIEAFNIIDLIFTYDPMFVIDSLKPNIPEQKFKHMLSESNYAEMNLLVEKKKIRRKKDESNIQESISKERDPDPISQNSNEEKPLIIEPVTNQEQSIDEINNHLPISDNNIVNVEQIPRVRPKWKKYLLNIFDRLTYTFIKLVGYNAFKESPWPNFSSPVLVLAIFMITRLILSRQENEDTK